MPPPRPRAMSRLWAKDEELAKKDDDLRAGHAHSPHWQPSSASRTPRRRSVLRLLAYLAAAVLLVVTLSRVVSSPSIPARPSPYPDAQQQQHQPPAAAPPPPPAAPPPAADAAPPPPPPAPPAGGGQGAGAGGRPAPKPQQVRNYNGPIKLPNLGSTIQAIGRTDGRKPLNRNVMFAAASLRSVATVAPMACQMARERLNYVHFVFFGRSDIALRTLLEVNGVDAECHVIVHDARPDYVTTSTETRMKLATARTMSEYPQEGPRESGCLANLLPAQSSSTTSCTPRPLSLTPPRTRRRTFSTGCATRSAACAPPSLSCPSTPRRASLGSRSSTRVPCMVRPRMHVCVWVSTTANCRPQHGTRSASTSSSRPPRTAQATSTACCAPCPRSTWAPSPRPS